MAAVITGGEAQSFEPDGSVITRGTVTPIYGYLVDDYQPDYVRIN
ncbi:hypothetical protein R8Z57_08970 [Microbacterium sp. M3]|uniref:Uncharacterized protein n=1 Tax=Microbacterium arthrosphaerae TaxID=792652 RepID=A0ABU4H2K7_9MICO|nr:MULTISPECIES: hypothetical protein [Microbacterium]MDW4572900.1 hypothetical protein [Microbacterium arthrosphaerae]MDW7606755.1 hypothetical protein [Microbacterium sp. M3]